MGNLYPKLLLRNTDDSMIYFWEYVHINPCSGKKKGTPLIYFGKQFNLGVKQ